MSVFSFELSSGVRMAYQYSFSPVAYVGFMVRVGSRDESLPGYGMAHLLEHMLFKGTANRAFVDILNEIEGVGGDFNAYTSREETCLYVSIHNKYFERAFSVLADIFYNSTLPTIELEKEKQIVVDEINFYKDSPSEIIVDDFEEMLFKTSSLSHRILGDESLISELIHDQLYTFYKNHYITKNLVISFVGNIPVDEVMRVAENVFSVRHTSPDVEVSNDSPVNTFAPFHRTLNKKLSQSHCILGVDSMSILHDDKYKMFLFNNLLGGSSFNSILNIALREELGLTYNIESTFVPYSDAGVFYIYFGTDKSKVEKCISVIQSKLSDLKNGSLSGQSFEMYKNQIIGQLVVNADNFLNEMILNAKSLLFTGAVYSLDDVITQYSDLTALVFNTFLEKTIDTEKLSLLHYY